MFRMQTEAFVKSMKAASKRLETFVGVAVDRTAQAASTYAKLTTLFRHRTYSLRSSIEATRTGKFSARTSANAKHAAYMEYGTVRHDIFPRRKKALRFVQNGAVQFRSRVSHPGTKPRPFMQQARDRVEPLFDRLCREVADRIF